MKIAFKTMLLLASIGFMTACSSSSSGEKVAAEEATEEAAEASVAAQDYVVNTETSLINWTGTKSFIESAHSGTIALGKGMLSVENGQITAGNFSIAMASMKNTDIEDAEKAAGLVEHLVSEDFFKVEEYPTATFEITEVAAVTGDLTTTHSITGNLTLLGTAKQVTIPANVAIAEGKLTATTADFTIDRTQWGINYGGEEAAKLANVAKNRIISNDISLKIMLNAAAK